MPHALACWGGDARDKAYHWLFHVVFDPESGFDFIRAADLTDHDDGVGLWVVIKRFHYINVL
jgi:hypothetical protein